METNVVILTLVISFLPSLDFDLSPIPGTSSTPIPFMDRSTKVVCFADGVAIVVGILEI